MTPSRGRGFRSICPNCFFHRRNVTSEMFASRHTSKIDRPPSACLKMRILFSVLYFLPFIRLVPFGPRLSHPSTRKGSVTSLRSECNNRAMVAIRFANSPTALFSISVHTEENKRTINAPHLCSPIQGFNAHQEKQRLLFLPLLCRKLSGDPELQHRPCANAKLKQRKQPKNC